jgi:hypothetical protein
MAISTSASSEPTWLNAGNGYELALEGRKLLCRNLKTGKQLGSIPKKARESEAAQELLALRDWLDLHNQECRETIEIWMLRSLPFPRALVASVWDDPSWRGVFENVVVAPIEGDSPSLEEAGFLRGVDPDRKLGVVNLDGETEWLEAALFAIPHPNLLADLADYRELAAELDLCQGISQLFRETWSKPEELDPKTTSIRDYAEGKFDQLNFVLGKCKTLGYRVRGGFAICPVWEQGRQAEARYWVGAEYPENETYTGELLWVDAEEKTLSLGAVGPVAYSEGIRMANAIYAARKIEDQGEGR